MFGIAVARLDKVSEEEKLRYQGFYCGVCRSIKEIYGQISRLALSYDLAFLVMLSDSLQEPKEETGSSRCISHPKKKMPFIMSKYSYCAADLSIALAYHKCLDDVHDDDSTKAKAAERLLRSSYALAQERIPEQCRAVEECMDRTRKIETSKDAPLDDAANAFGELLGKLFKHDQGIWSSQMRDFGYEFGKFVYLMDAAVDLEDDKKAGSYNPFSSIDATPEFLREILTVQIGKATQIFERLPLMQDVNLMRSVLYSGVWQKFNQVYYNDEKAN